MILSLDRLQFLWEEYYLPYVKWPRFHLGVMDMTFAVWTHFLQGSYYKDAAEIVKLSSPPYNYGSLHIAVWLYALQEKDDTESDYKVKGISTPKYHYTPMVNVCLSTVNTQFFSFNKADIKAKSKYKYHQSLFSPLLQAESLNKIGVEIGKTPKPTIPCPDYNRCPSKNRAKYDAYVQLSPQQQSSAKDKDLCRNRMGNCAEQRAANELLIHPNIGQITLPSLKFSLAIRPRTMEIQPFCCNCYTLFPQLK